jgi:hypothetical protein
LLIVIKTLIGLTLTAALFASRYLEGSGDFYFFFIILSTLLLRDIFLFPFGFPSPYEPIIEFVF